MDVQTRDEITEIVLRNTPAETRGEVWLRAAQGIDRAQNREAYIRTIAYRVWMTKRADEQDWLKRFAPLPKHGRAREQNGLERTTERERHAIIAWALEQIKPIQRAIITRFHILGYTEEEIREELRLTPNQFRNEKNHGLVKMRDLIAERMRRGKLIAEIRRAA